MTLATLADVLEPARTGGYAVAGLVVLGWEEARAFTAAGQAEGLPIILQAGPACRRHTPLPVLGAMFRHLAASVDTPVVALLDHGYTAEECRTAIEAGFSSVMIDGSRLPLDENIALTRDIARMAHDTGISCEGEIGFVGYDGGEDSRGTDPQEAARFAAETGIDAMAISVGNTHLQTRTGAGLDEERIAQIAARCDVPLVIHGGSGVPPEQRTRLARTTPISKYNIGTEIRQVFGAALRDSLAARPDSFDRIDLLAPLEAPIEAAARRVIRALGPA